MREMLARMPRWSLLAIPAAVVAGMALAVTSSSVARRFAPPAGVPDTLSQLRVAAPRTPQLFEGRYLQQALDPAKERERFLRDMTTRYNVTGTMARMIHDAAVEEGIDPELGFRLIRVESVFDPGAIGAGGATGLVQMMPGTARSLDPAVRTRAQLLEPRTNLRLGFGYLRDLIERYEEHGDDAVRLGVLAYNRGEVAVDRALRRGVDPENGYGPRVLGPRAHAGRSYQGPGIVPQPESADTVPPP
jgi:soluble lytic murein transglycosylase-like protein